MGFPTIPGAPSPEGLVNMVADHDYGPEFRSIDLRVHHEGTAADQATHADAGAKVDADGFEVGGDPSGCGRRRWERTSAGT